MNGILANNCVVWQISLLSTSEQVTARLDIPMEGETVSRMSWSVSIQVKDELRHKWSLRVQKLLKIEGGKNGGDNTLSSVQTFLSCGGDKALKVSPNIKATSSRTLVTPKALKL